MDPEKLTRMKEELRRNCEQIAEGHDPVQQCNGLDSYRIFVLCLPPMAREGERA